MKIKVALLDREKRYLSRMVTAFGAKYADKLEIYSFTDPKVALDTLSSARIDVLLASDQFDIDPRKLPNRCAFAYLVDSPGFDTLKDQSAICKFQKAELIYKQILSVYSEKASNITGFTVSGDESMVIVFCAANGGVGSSGIATSCAASLAGSGKKVLYLNLEKFGSSDVFFSGQGQFDMSDIIFALKSKKTNLPLKLESCVKQDPSGVYFYSCAKIALDMMELTTEDILHLITELKLRGGYEYIVVDIELAIDKEMLKVYRQAQMIVMVGDGSAESNVKTERAFTALETLEQGADAPLTDRMYFVYDKSSHKDEQPIDAFGLKVLGGIPRYAGANVPQIVEKLSRRGYF